MAGLARQPLATFLDRVAQPTPAPGGGCSAAVACGLGAALVEMAAGIEGGRHSPGRLEELRVEALELAERELDSYAPVLEARRLPAADPERAERVAAALERASDAPLAIAELAAEVAELGAELAAGAGPSVRGDALAGVLVAEASAAAAAALVKTNLGGAREPPALMRARAASARAGAARERAVASV